MVPLNEYVSYAICPTHPDAGNGILNKRNAKGDLSKGSHGLFAMACLFTMVEFQSM